MYNTLQMTTLKYIALKSRRFKQIYRRTLNTLSELIPSHIRYLRRYFLNFLNHKILQLEYFDFYIILVLRDLLLIICFLLAMRLCSLKHLFICCNSK